MLDGCGRTINYLRLSVTDLCNYRCRYCMPPEGVAKRDHGDILSLEELADIARAAVRLGVKKIRLTGGEPLVRQGIVELCRQLRREYGVTLLLSPAKEQLEGADVLLLFDRREDLKPGGVVLPLYEGAQTPLPPLLLPPAMEERLPAGADRGQLLAALREAGALRPGQITVGLPRMEAQTMLQT